MTTEEKAAYIHSIWLDRDTMSDDQRDNLFGIIAGAILDQDLSAALQGLGVIETVSISRHWE